MAHITYTIVGSARDTIASLRAEIEALKGAARTEAASVTPESARVAEIGMKATRAEHAASKADGFYCARHKHGFAFRKTTCPRDGGPLA